MKLSSFLEDEEFLPNISCKGRDWGGGGGNPQWYAYENKLTGRSQQFTRITPILHFILGLLAFAAICDLQIY
jgi:hypothetical protein